MQDRCGVFEPSAKGFSEFQGIPVVSIVVRFFLRLPDRILALLLVEPKRELQAETMVRIFGAFGNWRTFRVQGALGFRAESV